MNLALASPRIDAIQRSLHDAVKVRTVAQILARNGLSALYQPIVRLQSGTVVAHESLIRGPADSPLQAPDALFAAARRERLTVPLEEACIRVGLRGWLGRAEGTRLFLNLSAHALVAIVEGRSLPGLMRSLQEAEVPPASLVIEITEHEQVTDMPRLLAAAAGLRAHGLRFALDDFGEGRSSLRLWAELRPEIVKIDKYFIHDLDRNAVKVQTLKGIKRFAETSIPSSSPKASRPRTNCRWSGISVSNSGRGTSSVGPTRASRPSCPTRRDRSLRARRSPCCPR